MNEIVMRNATLGVEMTKTTLNGETVIFAESMRDALKWDSVPHMIRTLKEGVEYYKVSVKDLKAMGWNFAKFGKVKPNTLYAYFVTEQGVMRLIATRKPHDVKSDPALAEWLDRLQDWIFGEVLVSVAKTGAYMTPQVAQSVLEDPQTAVKLAQEVLRQAGVINELEAKNKMLSNTCFCQGVRLSQKDNRIKVLEGKLNPEYRECPEGYRPVYVKGYVRFERIRNPKDAGKYPFQYLLARDRARKLLAKQQATEPVQMELPLDNKANEEY